MWFDRLKTPWTSKNRKQRNGTLRRRAARDGGSCVRTAQMERLEDRRMLVATVSVGVQNPVAVSESAQQRIVYSLSRDESEDMLVVRFELSGNAIYDIDYTVSEVDRDTVFLPEDAPLTGPVVGTATFYPGESSVDLIVRPIQDSLIERNENIVVSVVSVDSFGPIDGAAARRVEDTDTIYYVVDTLNRFATVDVQTGVIDVIGTMNLALPVSDIAVTEEGDLYAITATSLYEIHPDQVDQGVVSTHFVGPHGIAGANALIDARNGDFGSQAGDLFAVGASSLDLQRIDLEKIAGQWVINDVTTVFDIDGALASKLLPSNYFSRGDLDYVTAGHLILSAARPSDAFDSLIEIRTPGSGGTIENAPKAAQDPGEDFRGIAGLAFDGNDSFGFAGYTMLRINPFNRDSSREMEMTGREYVIGNMASATGTIIGDPVAAPQVTLNSLRANPSNLPRGPQPTIWAQQRSEISDVVIRLGASIPAIPDGGIVLTNLGTTTAATPVDVSLRNDQLVLAPSGDIVTLLLDQGQLPDGRYRLTLSPDISSGPAFTLTGDRSNRFFVLSGDWNGNAVVELLDFATYAYWFGSQTPTAPRFVDLDGSGMVSESDFDRFLTNFADTVALPGVAPPIAATLVDAVELQRAYHSVINPLDVNGNQQISPLDALNVLNRLSSGFSTATDWRYDVNRDGGITPRDALLVLNAVALQSPPPTNAPPAGWIINQWPGRSIIDDDDQSWFGDWAVDEVFNQLGNARLDAS